MVQFNNMSENIKKRVNTALILLTILFLMLINNFILGYFLIIISLISILEFNKIILIIFKKKKIKQIFFNILFIIYIFSFSSIFLVLSSFLQLKVLIFILVLTCIISDIGGYIFGNFFKGRKLTKISPNKTISGSIGSFLLSFIFLSLVVFYLTKNFDLINITVVSFVTSLSCQLGDLFFSFLKRKSLLKDTGNILPGHGGILDRIDGILFGVPTGFLILVVIY